MEWFERGMKTLFDKDNIRGFFDQYRWLSNFHECTIHYGGLTYLSTEAAYQAAKSADMNVRMQFLNLTPNQAKKLGQKIELRKDWEQSKLIVMEEITFIKYSTHPELKEKLLDTGDKYLEETNWWKDEFWGVCNEIGKNNLGKILMKVREQLK